MTRMPNDVSRRSGRPRDPRLDAQALAAVLELLAEQGFEATTVQAVAGRSGVHASAIYRRWHSRVELIEEAVFPGFDQTTVQPTGDLRKDLRRFIRAFVATFASPATRAAFPGLLAHYQNTGRARSAEEWLGVSARPQFQDILCAAPPGSIDPTVDPDDVFDMLLGAVLARSLVPTIVERGRPIERMVDLALRLLHPDPDPDPASDRLRYNSNIPTRPRRTK